MIILETQRRIIKNVYRHLTQGFSIPKEGQRTHHFENNFVRPVTIMKICPYCAHINMEGMLFCEDCGEILLGDRVKTTSTRQLDEVDIDLIGKSTWGTARFGDQSSIILHVRDAPDPLVLAPAEETTLGRADVASGNRPGVDLTPFGAQEKGVSRLHAAIRRGDETLTLVDLGSSNGTHLNGQRLTPNQPRVLRDGDEIRLGKLVCHIYFK